MVTPLTKLTNGRMRFSTSSAERLLNSHSLRAREAGGYPSRAAFTARKGTQTMAELRETLNRHAQDVVSGNMAGLMGDFTPEAMTKVMALASNPITATSFEVKELGNNEAEISYIGASTRKVWSRWADNNGKFQIVDVKEV